MGLGAAQGTQAQCTAWLYCAASPPSLPCAPPGGAPSPPHPITPALRSDSSPSPYRVVLPLPSQFGTPAPSRWRPFPTLSGGQQALATLALAFAMQSAFPSPFCFFDEVRIMARWVLPAASPPPPLRPYLLGFSHRTKDPLPRSSPLRWIDAAVGKSCLGCPALPALPCPPLPSPSLSWHLLSPCISMLSQALYLPPFPALSPRPGGCCPRHPKRRARRRVHADPQVCGLFEMGGGAYKGGRGGGCTQSLTVYEDISCCFEA